MSRFGNRPGGMSVPPRPAHYAGDVDEDRLQYSAGHLGHPSHGNVHGHEQHDLFRGLDHGYFGGTLDLSTDESMHLVTADLRDRQSPFHGDFSPNDRRGGRLVRSGSPRPISSPGYPASRAPAFEVNQAEAPGMPEYMSPRNMRGPLYPGYRSKSCGPIEYLPPLEEGAIEGVQRPAHSYRSQISPQEIIGEAEDESTADLVPKIQRLRVSVEESDSSAQDGSVEPDPSTPDGDQTKTSCQPADTNPDQMASQTPASRSTGSYIPWEGVSYDDNGLNKEEVPLSTDELLSCFRDSKRRNGRADRVPPAVPSNRPKRRDTRPANDDGLTARAQPRVTPTQHQARAPHWQPPAFRGHDERGVIQTRTQDPRRVSVTPNQGQEWPSPSIGPASQNPHLPGNLAAFVPILSGNGIIHPDRLRMLGGALPPARSVPLQEWQEAIQPGWAVRQAHVQGRLQSPRDPLSQVRDARGGPSTRPRPPSGGW